VPAKDIPIICNLLSKHDGLKGDSVNINLNNYKSRIAIRFVFRTPVFHHFVLLNMILTSILWIFIHYYSMNINKRDL
jgi:hypothetical protein